MTKEQIQSVAKQVIAEESQSINKLQDFINDDFSEAVELIHKSKGRLIITGIGKSANIATKIVATLNSTGTPAIFMHAADAIHGDLGNVQTHDVVMCISKSGNTPEIKVLIPLVKSLGNKLIANVGNTDSFLAKNADLVLNSSVEKEACPNNLAPTSSTTAQLVVGDALAVALLQYRGFTDRDFAKYHPGGALGKQLYLRVADLCANNEKPMVGLDANIREIIIEISTKRLGTTAVIEGNKLQGIITDGDIRRMMQKFDNLDGLFAKDIMSKNPSSIDANELAVKALKIMKEKNITQLLVLKDGFYFGVIHLHDILKEGIL
ncbi:MAG: D-arabinose 5-phosphate isomerase [Bacteroidetes bacterium 4572_112]|nr:MAG: D-arabinose 5-phosphate isomerase [Bacteroidetes bacterium 4572_112]